MARSPRLVPPGTAFSYNNAGFYVLGRIVEVMRGVPFESVIRERILAPLGMRDSTYFPEEALGHSIAAGHIVTASGPRVAAPWHVPRSIAPGGGLISTVRDQLTYAAFHLGDGATPAAGPILARESLDAMQSEQATAGSMCDAIGFSWMLSDLDWPARSPLDGRRQERVVVKHGGATNGHLSSFELLPAHGFATTVLTNSDTGRGVRQEIADAAREHFLGLVAVPRPALPLAYDDLASFAGTYTSRLATLDVRVQDGRLTVTDTTPARGFAERRHQPLPGAPVQLVFYAPDRANVVEGDRAGELVEFLRDPGGNIAWMRWDGRLCRRDSG